MLLTVGDTENSYALARLIYDQYVIIVPYIFVTTLILENFHYKNVSIISKSAPSRTQNITILYIIYI